MANIEHKEDGDKWTNATLRQLLGEKGYIENKDTVYRGQEFIETRFERLNGAQVLYLFEYAEGDNPTICDRLGRKVDPKDITVLRSNNPK